MIAEDDREEEDDRRSRHASSDEENVDTAAWSVSDTTFILSAERLTGIESWNSEETIPSTNGADGTLKFSGTDVSFLGGSQSANLYTVPRLGFDGRFSSGLTLGGSLSYLVTSSKKETSQGAVSQSTDQPTQTIFVLAPRIGVLFEGSPRVSIWLRGGVTRISASSDVDVTTSSTITSTMTLIAVTLDPQLVFTPVPHVGITLGAALDIGTGGSIKSTGPSSNSSSVGDISVEHDMKASSYGVTAGLAALF